MNRKPATLPEVTLSEDGDLRYLHLGSPWVQGSMFIDKPFELHLEYIQRMMAGLLFLPDAAYQSGRAMQLGLGAASLTKFCHKRLRWATTAVEINPQVLMVCRQWFKLAPNDARLTVLLADAAHAIAAPELLGTIDLLHVDLYDHNAAAPVLDSDAFYRDCFNALADGGVMAVNLFGRMASFDASVEKITAGFGGKAFAKTGLRVFKPTREGNQVVLAQRHAPACTKLQLQARAELIEAKFKLPALKWLKQFSGKGAA